MCYSSTPQSSGNWDRWRAGEAKLSEWLLCYCTALCGKYWRFRNWQITLSENMLVHEDTYFRRPAVQVSDRVFLKLLFKREMRRIRNEFLPSCGFLLGFWSGQDKIFYRERTEQMELSYLVRAAYEWTILGFWHYYFQWCFVSDYSINNRMIGWS